MITKVEYLVFFGLILFTLILYFRYKDKVVPVYEGDPYLNKCESPIETRLYKALKFNGYSPVTQHPVGRYRIDIAFPGSLLALECDGKEFHSSPKQKAHDRRKDRYLKENGWTVLRFSGRRIYKEMPQVLGTIEEHLRT